MIIIMLSTVNIAIKIKHIKNYTITRLYQKKNFLINNLFFVRFLDFGVDFYHIII